MPSLKSILDELHDGPDDVPLIILKTALPCRHPARPNSFRLCLSSPTFLSSRKCAYRQPMPQRSVRPKPSTYWSVALHFYITFILRQVHRGFPIILLTSILVSNHQYKFLKDMSRDF